MAKAVFLGSLCGFFLRGPTFRSFPLLGVAFGYVIGYDLPTANVEHRDVFEELRGCILNVIHFAVLGAVIGLILDIAIRPRRWPEKFQFSLSTMIWFVTVFAIICGAVRAYIQILSVQR
jgi:hypothetical protein